MYPFELKRPTSLDEARSIYTQSENAVYLAGGMTILPTMKQHLNAPDDVIDLSGIPGIKGIRWEGDTLTLGALTTHAEVTTNTDIRKRFPALSAVAGMIADRHVRNRGTIGGSLANNDPASDYPAAVLATGIEIATSDRVIAPKDFFTGLFETLLEPGEIVKEIKFNLPSTAVYEKFPHPLSGYAMAGVFVSHSKDATQIAVCGAGADGVFRLSATEAAVHSGGDVAAALDADLADMEMLEDHYAEGSYRENLVKVLCTRALVRIA